MAQSKRGFQANPKNGFKANPRNGFKANPVHGFKAGGKWRVKKLRITYTSGYPIAGPKPWRSSTAVATNVFRKPRRRGFKAHGR